MDIDEKASADIEAAELFANEFIELFNNETLSLGRIYNADETGLFSQYTLALSTEKAPTGVKDSKARLTIFACANAALMHNINKSIPRSQGDVLPDNLKNFAWHNLEPATIFHGEDDEDDSREFEVFRTLQTKGENFQLLDYVKKCGEAVINEDYITEVFHCDDNAPIINQLTDVKIYSMVLDPENTISDSEESDREVIENKKNSIDMLVGILGTAITGLKCKQWNFVTEQEIMSVYRIKEKVLAQKMKQLKQLTLKEMFNKINK
ncbi:Tigger transposable element-derived protein 2, partial [Stegodyphus mimosarum]